MVFESFFVFLLICKWWAVVGCNFGELIKGMENDSSLM